jgi:IS605 OrfB family transposase
VKIVKTAKLKITSHTKIFDETLAIYRKALTFYINICEKEFNNFKNFQFQLEKRDYIEQITHKTKNRIDIAPDYDFGKDFYKFPSYLRRSLIMEAVGIIESHNSRFEHWKKLQEKAKNKAKKKDKKLIFHLKPPVINYEPGTYPTLYKDNIYLNKNVKEGKAQVKIYKNNDWIWIDIDYSLKNLYSSKKFRFTDFKVLSPNLIKKGKKYFLHISFETAVKLPKETKKFFQSLRVIGVDLGLNTSAVCTCMEADGTIIDRKFIDQSREKDHLIKKTKKLYKLRRTKLLQTNQTPNKSRKIKHLKKQIIQETVNDIVNFALKNKAKVIVFEYLGKMLGKNKTMRMKVLHWNKNEIQQKVIDLAHSHGIRVSRVLARGTSKYAYDGSGITQRNPKRDIAIFPTGKIYNSDLSASYNIAARYFIRNILKSYSEKCKLELQAKVPEILDRSRHTLSSLISLKQV